MLSLKRDAYRIVLKKWLSKTWENGPCPRSWQRPATDTLKMSSGCISNWGPYLSWFFYNLYKSFLATWQVPINSFEIKYLTNAMLKSIVSRRGEN